MLRRSMLVAVAGGCNGLAPLQGCVRAVSSPCGVAPNTCRTVYVHMRRKDCWCSAAEGHVLHGVHTARRTGNASIHPAALICPCGRVPLPVGPRGENAAEDPALSRYVSVCGKDDVSCECSTHAVDSPDERSEHTPRSWRTFESVIT